jgi:hypothetical protein
MKILNLDKKTRNFLAMLFCTLVIVSTIGSSFATRNSFAQAPQQQLQQIQQAPTVAYKSPWNNNMPISSVDSSQQLCAAGVCNPSSNPASTTTQPQSSATRSTTYVDPTAIKLSNTKANTNSKVLTLGHSFLSSKVVGPDRFRFVTSYWSTSQVSRLIDAGRSAGNVTNGFAGPLQQGAITPLIIPSLSRSLGNTFLSPASQTQLSNLQVEVDKDEGYSTLAIVLQYQGVVNLAGITAALKLPTGFEAQYPLADDRHNFDIALANYDGGIRPSQEVVLYFPIYVTKGAIPQLPVLGPLALHFLRSANRSILDTLDSSDQNLFAKALSSMNTNATSFGTTTSTTSPSTTTTTNIPGTTTITTTTGGQSLPVGANATTLTANLNDNLNFVRNNNNHFARFIPYNFIDQVIPVIFKATGREVLDIYQIGPVNPINAGPAHTGYGKIFPLRLALTNHGDIPLYNLVVQLDTVLPALTTASLGANSVVAPQLPIVIQGPATYYIGPIGAKETKTINVNISSALDCNSNQVLETDSSYNNIIGIRTEQANVVGVTTSGVQACPLIWAGSNPGGGGGGKAAVTELNGTVNVCVQLMCNATKPSQTSHHANAGIGAPAPPPVVSVPAPSPYSEGGTPPLPPTLGYAKPGK